MPRIRAVKVCIDAVKQMQFFVGNSLEMLEQLDRDQKPMTLGDIFSVRRTIETSYFSAIEKINEAMFGILYGQEKARNSGGLLMHHEVDLKRLQDETAHALSLAVESQDPRLKKSPVNWSNVHCTSVEAYMPDQGSPGVRVWIKGAAPNADALHAYCQAHLKTVGFQNVNVRTFW